MELERPKYILYKFNKLKIQLFMSHNVSLSRCLKTHQLILPRLDLSCIYIGEDCRKNAAEMPATATVATPALVSLGSTPKM
jgi:hypothetical protein